VPSPPPPPLLRLPRAGEGSWVRRHQAALALAVDVPCAVLLVVGAFLFAGEVVENDGGLLQPGFVLVCLGPGLWGALRGGLAVLTDGRHGPAPWVRLVALAAVVAIASALGGLLLPSEPDLVLGLTQGGALTGLMALLSVMIGFCAILGFVALALVVLGLLVFGRVLVQGSAPGGTPVPRRAAVAPFLGCVSLLGLPLTVAGVAAYDSPYRRDVLPLVGVVREGVEVTHPVLLHAAQVATWVMGAVLVVAMLLRVLLDEPADERTTAADG
jgi:hypothetical protein